MPTSRGLLAAVTTPGPLVWVMKPTTAYRIAATIGGTAAINVPATLFGIPLELSANSPAQITLLDPSQILYSDDATRRPPDAGLALIDRYEAAGIQSRMEHLQGSGMNAAAVARERAAVTALAATIAERLRADYLARTQR